MANEQIRSTELNELNNVQAERLLRQVVTDAALDVFSVLDKPEMTPEILAEAFGTQTDDSDVDIDKQALTVLNHDPVMDHFLSPEDLQKAKQKPLNFNLDPNSLITTTTLALVVLSTYIHIKKDASGKWTFEFRLKNSSEGLKKELIKLAQRLAGGGTAPRQ